MPQILIGTSGWHYASWWGPFFPQEVRKKDALQYYATRFRTAELNAPFYRTPTIEAVQGWRRNTPDDFVFAWKASNLGEKAGPILFQLPPQFHTNRERLASFLKMLKRGRRYTFEFRHASWYEKPILDLLRDNDVALLRKRLDLTVENRFITKIIGNARRRG